MSTPTPPDPGFELTPMGQLVLAACPSVPATREEMIAGLWEAAEAGANEAGPCEIARARLSFQHMATLVERWIATARAEGAEDAA